MDPTNGWNEHTKITRLMAENERLKAVNQDLVEALSALLERVELNGGLGEYKGGPPWAVRRATEALWKAKHHSQ